MGWCEGEHCLLTRRKSPTRRVGSMEPEGMRKGWTAEGDDEDRDDDEVEEGLDRGENAGFVADGGRSGATGCGFGWLSGSVAMGSAGA